MEFLGDYAEQVGEFFTWISNPDSSIPVVKLLQGIAAIIGAIVTALGAYKTWRYAEGKLGERLSEFLEREEEHLVLARKEVAALQKKRTGGKRDRPELFSNRELNLALKQVRKRKFRAAQTLLTEALIRTQEREDKAKSKASLHLKQKAMAHLLLGAIADNEHRNDDALAHFKTALEIDDTDVEALEYTAVQLLKLGYADQARAEFDKLAALAESSGDRILQASAWRGVGKSWEPPAAKPSAFNANAAYKKAIAAFPNDGPPLEIAYIHEFRGMANLQLSNKGQASDSLTEALVKYTKAEQAKGADASEAKEGVTRVSKALDKLQQANAAAISPPATPAAVIAAAPPSAGALMGLGKFLGNQNGKSPPGDERDN